MFAKFRAWRKRRAQNAKEQAYKSGFMYAAGVIMFELETNGKEAAIAAASALERQYSKAPLSWFDGGVNVALICCGHRLGVEPR